MRTTIDLLHDLLQHVERAEAHANLTLKEFENSTARDAVLYNMIIMGEIVKLLPEALLSAHSDCAWSEVARFRDRSVHYYQHTSDARVWETLTEKLPILKNKVQAMLAELEPRADEENPPKQ